MTQEEMDNETMYIVYDPGTMQIHGTLYTLPVDMTGFKAIKTTAKAVADGGYGTVCPQHCVMHTIDPKTLAIGHNPPQTKAEANAGVIAQLQANKNIDPVLVEAVVQLLQ